MVRLMAGEQETKCERRRDFGPLLHTDLLQTLQVSGLSSLQRFSIGFRSGD